MGEQQCKTCKKTFELNEKNFRRFNTGRWAMSCKDCAKVIARANYKFRGKHTKPKKKEPIQKKDISKINLVIGKYYRVIFPVFRDPEDSFEVIGKCIFQNDRFFTIESDNNNIRESFLKVDSILNIYQLKKGRC